MAGITAEGKLWIDLAEVYAWLQSRGTKIENASGIRFDIECDALVMMRDGKDAVEIDAAEFWGWVCEKQMPAGLIACETLFGVPKVECHDLVISFATSNFGNPRSWSKQPECLAEWKTNI